MPAPPRGRIADAMANRPQPGGIVGLFNYLFPGGEQSARHKLLHGTQQDKMDLFSGFMGSTGPAKGRFHGTSSAIKTLDDTYYSTQNIYGQGFYTTNSFDVAKGYTKKGRGVDPALYDVKAKDVQLFDMESPVPDVIRGLDDDLVKMALSANPANTRELYDSIRDIGTSDYMSADTIQEVFDMIRWNLEQEGYRGLKHIGGQRHGVDPHEVNIYWFPGDDVAISPLDPSGWRKP